MTQRQGSDWPDEVELQLDGIAQGGEAVGRWRGRVVFAAGGLPGERVLVRLDERREAYARGTVFEVLEASPDRVEPRLPDADHMPWQHIAYEAQLRLRRQIVVDQLARIGGLHRVPVDETRPASAPWAYRTSARLHASGRIAGYHAAATREIREIEHDPLLRPVLNTALAALGDALREEPPDAPSCEVTLRASETYGYALGALRGRGDRRRLAGRWRARCPQLAGVTLPEQEPLGAASLVEELDGVLFELRPTTFFQVSVTAAEVLLDLVREGLWLRGDERLLDLYCGAGTFALPLARDAGLVLGVEEHPGAVADGLRSAELNGIETVSFATGQVERVLAELDERPDAAVLDPPRRGCHPAALDELIRLAPPRVVYVSCHPATLARDLKLLTGGGYHVRRVTPVDLFPQTAHVECVAVLTRG